MVNGTVRIKNPTGLHLRPAGLFCKTAMQFDSKITIRKTPKACSAYSAPASRAATRSRSSVKDQTKNRR